MLEKVADAMILKVYHDREIYINYLESTYTDFIEKDIILINYTN